MKKVLINVEERELRVAILEDEQLVELYIESLDEKSILNNIYKGRVEDILPGLKAAFVNIGLDRNAFLHFDDVRPDLLWAKYRELHPEMADEVPSAREALAEATDADSEESSDTDDRRKRRRGRRGGKKRRPDGEDSYSPGLPVGVTEDDLEDDDEEDSESTAVSAGQDSSPDKVTSEASARTSDSSDHRQDDRDQRKPDDSTQGHGSDEAAEARKLARQERQRQRRERWEQRKLERQQRREQQRAERGTESPEAGNEAPVEDVASEVTIPPPPIYGTRGAASVYDNYAPQQMTAAQRRQNKARYGDNFGNIAPPSQRRHDHRESQADFFGPAAPVTEEESSIWDERQPNLGPVPGLGKAFLDIGLPRRDRRGNGSQGQRRTGGNNNDGQQNQNRNRKSGGGKRRGGKKRSMRKRDNRSYFAFSADDIDKEIPAAEPAVETAEAPPKKTTRKTKAASETGDEAKPKKTTTRKTAATKKSPAKASKAAAAKEDSAELPLDIDASTEQKQAAAEEKPKRTRKTTTAAKPRAKKSTTKAPEAQEDLISAESDKAEAPAKKSETAEKSTATDAAELKSDAAVEAKAPAEPVAKQDESPAGEDVAKSADAPTADAPAETSATGSDGETGEARSGQDRNGRRRRNSRAERAARHRQRKAESASDEKSTAEAAADNDSGATAEAEPAKASEKESSSNVPAVVAEQPAAAAPAQSQGGRRDRDPRRRLRKPYFQEVFRKGDEIMVQVVKEEIGMKGARISSYVSLPGRYLVLLPYPNQEGGISRKVEDVKERKRLKNLLRDISSDETAFIVRTAGIYQEEKEIHNDVEFLSHEWETIADTYKKVEPKSLVYDDHDILYRLARDVFDDSVSEILIDSHVEAEKLKGILGKLIPGLVDKVKLYSGAENIFHRYGINKQIQKAARRKVWLKSGGYLIIDEAEALTAIDVNTGKSVGKDDQEKLILRTNLEAARAVARELKLRDIGGLIVIDFIDMKDTRNKDQVLSELKLQLRKDRSKTSVSAISEFGLVEMTRKRVRRSLRKTIFMDCPYCQGAGAVLNEQQIWLHIKHEIVRQLESAKPAPTLNITVNPKIRAYLDQNYRDVIRRLEQKYDTEIRITMSDIFHIENYQIEKLETTGVINGSATMPGR